VGLRGTNTLLWAGCILTLLLSPQVRASKSKKEAYRKFLNLGGQVTVRIAGHRWEPAKRYKKGSNGYQTHRGGKSVRAQGVKNRPILGYAISKIKAIRFTVPKGEYRIRLYFAEYWKKSGTREFTVKIEGKRRMALALRKTRSGEPRVVVSPKFTVIVTDGVLDVTFHKAKGGDPIANAISVVATGRKPNLKKQKPRPKPVPRKTVRHDRRANGQDEAAKARAAAEARRERLAGQALKRARKHLEGEQPDLVGAYFALKDIHEEFRGAKSAQEAQEQALELFSTPATGRYIRRAIKEKDAEAKLRIIKSYLRLKMYEVAYQNLRELIKEYRATEAAAEAGKLLDDVRKLRRKSKDK